MATRKTRTAALAVVPAAAAVVSALRDATGRDLTRVPVKPDELVGL